MTERKYTLLPCPFCGHQPDEENLIDSTHPINREGTLWTTGCLDNEGGCNASMLAGSRQEAIDKWNARASSAAAPAEPTRSQKLADAGYKRKPTTWEIQHTPDESERSFSAASRILR